MLSDCLDGLEQKINHHFCSWLHYNNSSSFFYFHIFFKSDSSAEYVTIIANCSKLAKENGNVSDVDDNSNLQLSVSLNIHEKCSPNPKTTTLTVILKILELTIMIMAMRITKLLNRRVRDSQGYNDVTMERQFWMKNGLKLRDAYFRGIDQNDIDIITLDPPATFECSCIVKKTATVACIFKCEIVGYAKGNKFKK
ncbi:hypothetical protein BDC45DRAFT_539521 [Circinella umbellata]|nr:hypothetical protein BDC45DRAFT_539521 [Circinella umbellata]